MKHDRKDRPTIFSKSAEIPLVLQMQVTRRHRVYICDPAEYSYREVLYLPYFLSCEDESL